MKGFVMIDLKALGEISQGDPTTKIKVSRAWLKEVHDILEKNDKQIRKLVTENACLRADGVTTTTTTTRTPFPEKQFDDVMDSADGLWSSVDKLFTGVFGSKK